MKSYTRISHLFVCLLAVIMTGCGINSLRSTGSGRYSSTDGIDPFDFGDEFSEETIQSNISDSRDSGSIDSSIPYNGDPLSVNSGQSGNYLTNLPADSNTYKVGYSVQIGVFEVEDSEEAEIMKDRALRRVTLPVYNEYITPFYRVRVGDFLQRSEAEGWVKILKDKGFRDARWVRTNINSQ